MRPPTERFAGDLPVVSVEAVPGALRFTATGPNAAGVLTELMAQRLPNVRRAPTRQYKGIAFAAFADGALSVDVPVEPGMYACGTRFVKSATGQVSLMLSKEPVLVS